MRKIYRVTLALLGGFSIHCLAYAQDPGYRTPPQPYEDDRRQEDRYPDDRYRDDRRYDEPYRDGRDYDDRDYDDRDYDDRERGYGNAPRPRDEVGFFYDELSPYGDWILSREYGWAWFPRDVHSYWRPYSEGRWVNTEYGWTWASYEPFGWATYHYGRWAWDRRFGWLWVPGTTWGPAWVSWQYGGGYVGWAPLPPSVGFEVNVGIRIGGLDLNFGIQPNVYSFVPERSFLESRLSAYLIPSVRNVTIIRSTRNVTDYSYIDNRVINRGVAPRNIERATGRRVRQLRVGDGRTRTRTEVGSNEIRIYRPRRQQLESVHVEPGTDRRRRGEAPPAGRDRNAPGRRDAPEFEVAPRVDRRPAPDARQNQVQERRGQQELERYQAEEARKLEKLHQQEISNVRVTAERDQVQKDQKAEREALQQEQKNAAQQLDERQKARRQAEVQPAPERASPQGEAKPDDRRPEKGKPEGKDKDKDKDKDKSRGGKPQGEDKPGEPPPV